MQKTQRQDILLESGTNELEIVEFKICDEIFGINVAKVLEIMLYCPVKKMPNAHAFVEGVFKPRNDVITVVDLAQYLQLPPSPTPDHDLFIVTSFNSQVIAFHIHQITGIDRISWENIKKPDKVIYGGDEGTATGIAEYDGRLITILDFEKIIAEICPDTGIQIENVKQEHVPERAEKAILIAEDSMLLSKMIVECLHRAGYTRTIKCDDGQEAWDRLCFFKDNARPLHEQVDLIVTDIEMPQMDGHRLTKLVKEDKELKDLPVIIFSSLINDAMRIKGQQLGADAQVTKPEINKLVGLIDGLLSVEVQ